MLLDLSTTGPALWFPPACTYCSQTISTFKPKINGNLDSASMNHWSKFRNPNLNRWWEITWTSSKHDTFSVTFDLKGQGQSITKTKTILPMAFCNSWPNMATKAWTGHKLSRGKSQCWRMGYNTDRRTDVGNGTTRRPKLHKDNKIISNNM